jgi:hypothetical protein
MPSLEQWFEAIAEARRKYQKAILEAREQVPPEEE